MKKEELEIQIIENARVKYQVSMAIYASEGQILWNRYNVMLVVNSVFIGIIAFSLNPSSTSNLPSILRSSLPFAPVLGVVVCILWYRITDRGYMWMKHWIQEANELEKELAGNTNPIEEGRKLRNKVGSNITQNSSNWIIGIFIGIYVIIFLSNC